MRISNFPEHKSEVQVIERVVTKVQPVIEYVDRVVMHEVKSAPETIVVQKEVDLKPLTDKIHELEARLRVIAQSKNDFIQQASAELEMQRRALVALKMQQVIDRRNRLRLLKRLNKEKQKLSLWALIKKVFKG